MVMISGEVETARRFMATAPPEKSRPLHNFDMRFLKWGNQKHLRCMKVNPNGEMNASDRRSSLSAEAEPDGKYLCRNGSDSEKRSLRKHCSASSSPARNFPSFEKFRKPPPSPIGDSSKLKADKESDDGIEEIRAKLLVHLRTVARKMKFPVPEDEASEESAARPWNLRTRRAACKNPNETGGGSKNENKPPEKEPFPTVSSPPAEIPVKSQRLRSLAAAQTAEKKDRRKFSVALSRDEIEEDFFSMTGSRPARRPKKRAKIIQKQLDACFPGLWLNEVTPDSYKVGDFPEAAHR